ncbi:hypothetical protein L6164_023176 [Bauhinia variegata]|uniref:Uncharacterized protein n=1 Tax=Bauhinia variegata TaxID=167791 RepID=A0ACB9MKM1_BAUVA|nr:hypothetical protein L6164_023176 [Bauhinia variegata]
MTTPQGLPLSPPPPCAKSTDSPADRTHSISPYRAPILLKPANEKKEKPKSKLMKRFRSAFRSLPIIAPSCKLPLPLHGSLISDSYIHGGTKITGTLFGHRKARVNLAFQEKPKCLPMLLLELAIPTGKLLQDMGMGLIRIALESEKKPNEKTPIVDEPVWTLFCNGKKTGYGVKREATDDDLHVMQLLHVMTAGAGILPSEMSDPEDGELAYMRADFERVIGSKDSETYYMMMPEGNNGPELTVFFVRV